ncbi:zinc-dependent alcohol dehydrogenase family protein [Nocardioides agariphilus]|uniref:Probable alcohol dehydrogenase AdhA n=2 Tax=Nocardioides agariphilus TaxID=433664 RepID=A0A930VHI1_9ACTN|nr:zinc-dependent alcohol dehydrogenase family protein [Nocardioides agariphilus]
MSAWAVDRPGPINSGPLLPVTRPVPTPERHEVLVRVTACGVCRTDLHLCEGDLAPRSRGVIPGHQVVGRVASKGEDVTGLDLEQRVGIAWLRRTCGECRWCRSGAENLCPSSLYTGWDTDGGFAEYATVPAGFAYPLPDDVSDRHLAPLLCAGIIGYRSLRRAELPPGGRLGIYGFGSSAHVTAQIALAQGAEVHVMTRSRDAQDLALSLGATWVGEADETPPIPLDSAIVFAPAGELVPAALAALDRGGTLALAGIHMSTIPALDYDRHLFQERTVRSVTANTRADGAELLRLAAHIPLDIRVTTYAFDSVGRALADLAADRVTGSAVVTL